MRRHRLVVLGFPALVAAAMLATPSHARDRAECERVFRPQVGQTGKNVIWVPTPDSMVAEMLRLAQVRPDDVVYDLGAGDGKIAIAAGKLGAQAIGIEYDARMARLAQCLAEAESAQQRTRIVQGDIFKEDFSRADVVTMYLLPELNVCLRHRLLALRPGTRVVSHQFMMEDWQPDVRSDRGSVYLWIVPARVAGRWSMQVPDEPALTLALEQRFQTVEGRIKDGTRSASIRDASLRGDRLQFDIDRGWLAKHRFEGVVDGDRMTGTLRRGARETQVTARREEPGREARWAAIQPQCHAYYAP